MQNQMIKKILGKDNCNRCGKKLDRIGRICSACAIRAQYKSRIIWGRENRRISYEITKMKPEIKKKLHDDIFKEIVEEEKEAEAKILIPL